MPQFLIQFSYAATGVSDMLQHPELDNAAQASAMVASLGGKVLGYWFSFGEFDGMVLLDVPDNKVAAAVAMAIRSTGNVTRLETTVLITTEEAKNAITVAGSASHLPPKQ